MFALAGAEQRRHALRGMALDALARADFERFERELRSRQLLPLIGTRAVAIGADLVPASFASAVSNALASARAEGMALDFSTRRVVQMLAERGIAAMPIKGPLLAVEAHGDIGLREAADIDLLVAPDDLDAAVEALTADGFTRPRDPRRRNGLPDLHFALAHPELARVELHWRVHWYERAFSSDMLAGARPADGLLRPRDEDLSASLLLFYARDGFYGLRLAADLAGWWDRHGDSLSGAFLEQHARRYPALAPALTAAAVAAEQMAGVPALGWLGSAIAGSHRVAIAIRLADWTQTGDIDQLGANISLVGGILGPRGSMQEFVRRELLVQGAPLLPKLAHAAKMCGRYALALWRVRGERPWVRMPLTP